MNLPRVMLRQILLVAAFGLYGGAGIRADEVAAPQLNEIDSRTRQRIALVEAYLANSQWPDAAELLRSLSRQSDTLENRFVILPAAIASFQHAIPLHRYVQDLAANLPPSQAQVRTELRRRADSLAQDLVRRGADNRNVSDLRRVVDSLFATSCADDALLRLGDFELQRGHPAMARGYWSQISSTFGHAEGPFSSYPDSDIPHADVRARFVLASILDHQFANARSELEILKNLHPNAKGTLGGVNVNYAATLEQALQSELASQANRHRSKYVLDPTFEPRWRAKLDVPAVSPSTQGTPSPIVRPMTLPVVVSDVLVFADGPTICARDIHSGKAVPWSDGANGAFFSANGFFVRNKFPI